MSAQYNPALFAARLIQEIMNLKAKNQIDEAVASLLVQTIMDVAREAPATAPRPAAPRPATPAKTKKRKSNKEDTAPGAKTGVLMDPLPGKAKPLFNEPTPLPNQCK